ncbi:DNA-3-methyladenine glycosylase III [Desulfuromusa kysingii]|uniref:DNA-3-methyladenine glycosylase III n=1 Tax=Desulfuromusa kysingii TaxID=37625 RepID=A0A1H4E388_9BACT|nr:endonuclease III domain-containing protein [Desulfuromusa kysingii]SEA79495.1 DNA-3-methyladenine glycosylase III [Desulfuromusa kysingii]
MNNLLDIYQRLTNHYGTRNWWPAETPFEVIVGAILTQNTNWKNVETAIFNLRQKNALTTDAILQLDLETLEQLIRPSGFFRQKAQRLQLFCLYLQDHYAGSLDALFAQKLDLVRDELLRLKGIGPETADAILLYAGRLPSFVVDAYTNRLFGRLGILSGDEKYADVRDLFMSQLPKDIQLYSEYHALIINHCKQFCRKKPLCPGCPCADICLEKQPN